MQQGEEATTIEPLLDKATWEFLQVKLHFGWASKGGGATGILAKHTQIVSVSLICGSPGTIVIGNHSQLALHWKFKVDMPGASAGTANSATVMRPPG